MKHENDYIDRVWRDNPDYIRKFYEQIPLYERLKDEVEYVIKSEIENAGIQYAQLGSRVKALVSFCEKTYRKPSEDPFKRITDLAGVRLVYLYSSDLARIEAIIEREFKVVEKLRKNEDVEKFGYGALHYLVQIKPEHTGARYEDLKPLLCEVQVRTILQNAWATVAHHLSYKQEADIPVDFRRKLNALAGLFETADDQFENLRKLRNQYQSQIKEQLKSNGLNSSETINLDNLIAYIKWKFPQKKRNIRRTAATLLADLQKHDINTLGDLDSRFTQEKIHSAKAKNPSIDAVRLVRLIVLPAKKPKPS